MSFTTRETKQKQALRDAFLRADRPVSPEEVLNIAREFVPRVSIATVYRNIHSLVSEGKLVAVKLPGVSVRYEMAGKAHHHHFQCDRCAKVYELPGCDFTPPKASLPTGFHVSGHEVILYGTCAACC